MSRFHTPLPVEIGDKLNAYVAHSIQRVTKTKLILRLIGSYVASMKLQHPEWFENENDSFLGQDELAILDAVRSGYNGITDIRKHDAVKALAFDPKPLLEQMVRHGILETYEQCQFDAETFNTIKGKSGTKKSGFARTLYREKRK